MILKNRLKVVSVLSAAALWFYVIAIVNPTSTTSMENLHVNISNTVELSENNLILSSESKPSVNVTLEGNISELRRLKKDDIRASIEIQNPSEGKNEALVHLSVPNNIKYTLEQDSVIVNLEKTISKEFGISLNLPSSKDISDYIVSKSINKVKVSGPRSSINRVDSIVAVIKDDNFDVNKDIGVQLRAVDIKGDVVENATLENSIIQVRLNKIEQKEVTVKPVLSSNLKNIILNPEKIVIYGEQHILDTIDTIDTEEINVRELTSRGSMFVKLILPEGVSTLKNISTEDIEVKNEIEVSIK